MYKLNGRFPYTISLPKPAAFLLGMASIFGFSTTKAATTSTTNNHPDTTINIPIDSVRPNRFDINTISNRFLNRPVDEAFFADIMRQYPFCKVISIDVANDPKYLWAPVGGYVIKTDSIIIHDLFSSDKTIDFQGQYLGEEALHNKLVEIRNNIPKVLTHELKHRHDRHTYSRQGLQFYELLEINIDEEISARIAERLLTEPIENIDRIVCDAIDDFHGHWNQYLPAIQRISLADVRDVSRGKSHGDIVGYTTACRMTYEFNDVCVLDLISPKTLEKLNKFVSKRATDIEKALKARKHIDPENINEYNARESEKLRSVSTINFNTKQR